MSKRNLTQIDHREREARPWLPTTGLAGAIYQGPDGEQVILQADGTLDAWPPTGLRSIASSPAPRRGR